MITKIDYNHLVNAIKNLWMARVFLERLSVEEQKIMQEQFNIEEMKMRIMDYQDAIDVYSKNRKDGK